MCQHDPGYVIEQEDQIQVCVHCSKVIAHKCERCWGQGMGEENDLECDWINFGNDLVICTDCNGGGWIYANGYNPHGKTD